jgi:hypothetical protein
VKLVVNSLHRLVHEEIDVAGRFISHARPASLRDMGNQLAMMWWFPWAAGMAMV